MALLLLKSETAAAPATTNAMREGSLNSLRNFVMILGFLSSFRDAVGTATNFAALAGIDNKCAHYTHKG